MTVNKGKPPKHYVGLNKTYRKGNRRFIAVNLGTKDKPDFQWKEVQYSWVGHKGKWYLQFDKNVYTGVTLENARYWEGPKYRGDMAYYGDGLGELPDPVLVSNQIGGKWFQGSQYKFYTSPTDTTENYVNFRAVSFKKGGTGDAEMGQTGYQSPFTLDGVWKHIKLGDAKGGYLRTVTAAGQQGYNWGVGAFFGTLRSSQNANRCSITFRIPSSSAIPNAKGVWLWYAASKVQDDPTVKPCWAGIYALWNGEIRYIRGSDVDGTKLVKLGNAYVRDKWHVIEFGHNAAHTEWFMTVDPNTAGEKTVKSTQRSRITGAQFDDVLLGAGPDYNISNNTIIGDILDRVNRYELDLLRMYVETTDKRFDEVLAPRWWDLPKFKLYANLGTKDGPEVDITEWAVSLPLTQGNNLFYTQNPANIDSDMWWISYEGNFGRSNKLPVRTVAPVERKEELFCDFNDKRQWERDFLVAHKQWGGTGQTGSGVVLLNGGVSAENVEVYPNYKNAADNVDGVLRCYANGQFYKGPVIGVDRRGNPSPTERKTEVGACIASRDYLGTGSFRMRIRAMKNDGCCNCCWTFHYEEISQNDRRWNEFLAYGDEGLHPQGSEDDGYYLVRNNEIDIEWPTAHKGSADMEVVRQDSARLNSWQGENRNWDLEDKPSDPNYWSEFTDDFKQVTQGALNDGEWHVVGFDWHTNDPNPPIDPSTGNPRPARRVDFYVDDVLVQSTSTHIPTIAGRFWMGTWFPRAGGNRWAGSHANYARDSMDIDWFHWKPFNETGMLPAGETYPNDVWHDWVEGKYRFHVTDELPPSVEMPPVVVDLLEKGPNGNFTSSASWGAGANPAEYVGQNRLEWRTDKKGKPAGQAGDNFFFVGGGKSVELTLFMHEIILQGSGLEILTYDSTVGANGIVKVTAMEKEYQTVKFKTATNGRLVMRRVAAARDFRGSVDIVVKEV